MAEISLREWYLESFGNSNILWGIVSGHPKLEDGMFVHTSLIQQTVMDADNKCLQFVTASGSNYAVAFDDIDYNPESVEKTKACLQKLNISASFIEESVVLSKRKERAFKKSLASELLNGDLYLELSECSIVRAYFKYNDEVLRLYGRCHSGMFTDSYLYTKGGIVDFRHFQFGWRSVNTYHISDTIQRLVVNNISGVVMNIDNREYPVGKNITCVTKDNHEEGLMSPDVVNGKSLFYDPAFKKLW